MNGETNQLFFSYKDDLGNIIDGSTIDYEKITAKNFSIAKKLLESPDNLAIAKLSDTEKATLADRGYFSTKLEDELSDAGVFYIIKGRRNMTSGIILEAYLCSAADQVIFLKS